MRFFWTYWFWQGGLLLKIKYSTCVAVMVVWLKILRMKTRGVKDQSRLAWYLISIKHLNAGCTKLHRKLHILPTTPHQQHTYRTQCTQGSQTTGNAAQTELRRQCLLTVSWERGGRRLFRGPGSKVSNVTVFQSMRTLLLTCLSHQTPPCPHCYPSVFTKQSVDWYERPLLPAENLEKDRTTT